MLITTHIETVKQVYCFCNHFFFNFCFCTVDFGKVKLRTKNHIKNDIKLEKARVEKNLKLESF